MIAKKTTLVLFGLLSAGIIAAWIGWSLQPQKLFEEKPKASVDQEIDYYLKAFTYRKFREDGKLQFVMGSPYLKHLKQTDQSLVSAPQINSFQDEAQWDMTAQQAVYDHQLNQLSLQQNVKLKLQDQSKYYVLNTDQVVYQTQSETLSMPTKLAMTTPELELTAAAAHFELARKQYTFDAVKAIYH